MAKRFWRNCTLVCPTCFCSTVEDVTDLTGAKITVIAECSGIDGMWGLRAENEEISIPIAKKLANQIQQAGGDVVTGDCNLANTAIADSDRNRPEWAAPALGVERTPGWVAARYPPANPFRLASTSWIAWILR